VRTAALFFSAFLGLAASQSGTITTVAGGYPRGDGGPAKKAALADPTGVLVDNAGNLFIYDSLDYRIRKVTPGGTISTIVGGGLSAQRDNGLGTTLWPGGSSNPSMAMDGAGNLYFSETNYNQIRKMDQSGWVTIIAGSGMAGFGGDGGPALAAQFNGPAGLAFDAAGNLYVADSGNNRVRRISVSGTVTTVAGTGMSGYGGDGGPATSARLSRPIGMAFDPDGNLFIADSGNTRVRKVTPDGNITTVAGGGSRQAADGLAGTAVSFPGGLADIACDRQGVLYVNTSDHVYRLTAAGIIQVVAGNAQSTGNGDGGPAIEAYLDSSCGMALDADGNVYRSETTGRVRRIDRRSGVIDTVVGVGYGYGDGGPAVYAFVPHPMSVAVDAAGNLWVAHGPVYKITAAGKISSYIKPARNCATPGVTDPVPISSFCGSALAVAADPAGNVYFTDFSQVYKVTPDGLVTILPGTETGRLPLDPASPQGRTMAADAAGNVYLPSASNHRIFKITPDGTVAVVAGNGTAGFSGDGGPAAKAQLRGPLGVAADAGGTLYIADSDNNRVRKVTPDGVISTIAGSGNTAPCCSAVPALQAGLGRVMSVAVDAGGTVFISTGGQVHKLTPSGVVTTVAGNGTWGNSGDGGPANLAALSVAWGLAADANGNLYLADTHNFHVRKVQGLQPFAADPAGLLFSFTLGAPAQSQAVTLSTPDREQRSFRVRNSAGWLGITPAIGTVGPDKVSLTFTANPASVGKGTYSTQVTIEDVGTGSLFYVPVTMTVSGTAQQLKVSPVGLAFSAAAGGGGPPAKSMAVLNTGTGAMDWSAATSTLAGGAWLQASPASGRSVAGQSTPQLAVSVAPVGLAAGTYYGLVTVNAPQADNSPQSAVVMLAVTPADQTPGPVLDPAGLVFTGAPGGANPGSQTVQAANLTSHALQFAASVNYADGKGWLAVTPANAVILAGQTQSLEVKANLQGLGAGVYRAQLLVNFLPDNVTQQVSALLVVAAGASKSAVRAAGPGCTASKLLPVFRAPGEGFVVTAGWPATLDVAVVDDCGQALNAGSVGATFSTGEPRVELVGVGEGRWVGTWASRTAQKSGVSLTVRARNLGDPPLEGQAAVTGGVKENPDQPLIASGGVINAASFRTQAPVAPGGYVAVFGSKLATGLTVAKGLPLPAEMGDTVAVLGGSAMALFFASERQVNGILPYGVADSTVQQLIVRRGKMYSLPEPVVVASSGPAVFTTDGSGKGQGHIYVATEEGLRLADASRPATAGEVVVVYATGLGAVTGLVKAGEAAPADPPARTMAPVKVTIGGQEAAVTFAGLAPGLAGVYQVNAVVPAGLGADPSAVLVLSVGEQSTSPPVTMAVTVEGTQ
jgi:uncharacterized protein (TIGR03437 family)